MMRDFARLIDPAAGVVTPSGRGCDLGDLSRNLCDPAMSGLSPGAPPRACFGDCIRPRHPRQSEVMTALLSRIAGILLLGALCSPAIAEQTTLVLRLTGLKLGTLAYADDVGPSTYAARMRFTTGGFAGLLSSVSFDAQAQGGRTSDGTLSPTKYSEESLRDGEREVTEIVWRGTSPDITVETPPQPDRLDPRQAVGSVDLMTGMHMLLRAIPPEEACTLDVTTYDGKRLMRLTLVKAAPDRSGQPTCQGTFSRLKGVAPKGMFDTMFAEFDMSYQALPDGRLRVDRMVLRTPVGRAVLAVE